MGFLLSEGHATQSHISPTIHPLGSQIQICRCIYKPATLWQLEEENLNRSPGLCLEEPHFIDSHRVSRGWHQCLHCYLVFCTVCWLTVERQYFWQKHSYTAQVHIERWRQALRNSNAVTLSVLRNDIDCSSVFKLTCHMSSYDNRMQTETRQGWPLKYRSVETRGHGKIFEYVYLDGTQRNGGGGVAEETAID